MKKIIISLCMFAITFALYAQNEKLRVAVFDPTSSGTNIDEGTKVAVRELISSVFVNTGKYNIVERSLLQQVMKEQKISFFLRNRKKLRTMMVAYIPVKVDDALILFLDGEVIGYGVASMGFHITLSENISGTHTLSLSTMLFNVLNIQIDLSAKKYFLFDWVTNKKIQLVN